MLKRIKLIKNIGRFQECKSAGCEFSKNTIVFGLNTHGKSTLTNILRSLRDNNSDILIGRKTFGTSSDLCVEIDFDILGKNTEYKFSKDKWNLKNENILIFDSKFINENIFSGENIEFDHQKNLNTIIIGKEGKELSDLINELQQTAKSFETLKQEKTKEFSKDFNNITLDQFRNLKEDSDIDNKIEAKQKEIDIETNKSAIITTLTSSRSNLSSIDFKNIKSSLEKTFDKKQEEIESHIKNNFKTDDGSKNFIESGLKLLKEKDESGKRKCVFCSQELNEESEKIIDLYSNFFKSGYKEIQKEVFDKIEEFKKINLEAILIKTNSIFKENKIDIEISSKEIESIVDLKNKIEIEFDNKKNLNYSVDFTDFNNLENIIKHLIEDIDKKMESISTIKSKTLRDIILEKKLLDATKARFEKKWIDFCTELEKIEKESNDNKKTREEKREELSKYSSSVFIKHKKTINELCNEMSADFNIEDFSPLKKIIGQNERIFGISFFNKHKIDTHNENDNVPNFKNTLSESDKRLLAFAFFLSLLKNDENIDKKIVVFDDPMSSFDMERRRRTAQIIADISYTKEDSSKIEPLQKIVLTHDDRFAKKLEEIMESTTLKIDGYIDNSEKRSTIAHSDFSEDFPDDEIISKIEKINDIYKNEKFSEKFETDCRIVLESIFKRKYYSDLKDDILKKKSVRTFTNTLNTKKIHNFDDDYKFKLFSRLCDDLNIESHDTSSKVSDGDKKSILTDFFRCLKEI